MTGGDRRCNWSTCRGARYVGRVRTRPPVRPSSQPSTLSLILARSVRTYTYACICTCTCACISTVDAFVQPRQCRRRPRRPSVRTHCARAYTHRHARTQTNTDLRACVRCVEPTYRVSCCRPVALADYFSSRSCWFVLMRAWRHCMRHARLPTRTARMRCARCRSCVQLPTRGATLAAPPAPRAMCR
jgi:hypothetical protein